MIVVFFIYAKLQMLKINAIVKIEEMIGFLILLTFAEV